MAAMCDSAVPGRVKTSAPLRSIRDPALSRPMGGVMRRRLMELFSLKEHNPDPTEGPRSSRPPGRCKTMFLFMGVATLQNSILAGFQPGSPKSCVKMHEKCNQSRDAPVITYSLLRLSTLPELCAEGTHRQHALDGELRTCCPLGAEAGSAESTMTVPGLVLHPRATRGLQAVVMSDSDFKAASASVGILGAQPDMPSVQQRNSQQHCGCP